MSPFYWTRQIYFRIYNISVANDEIYITDKENNNSDEVKDEDVLLLE